MKLPAGTFVGVVAFVAACMSIQTVPPAARSEGNDANLMGPIREAVKSYATIGEIFRALKDVVGEHHG